MSPREKQLLLATVAIMLCVLLKSLILSPFLERWEASGAQERDLGAAVANATSLASRLEMLKRDRATLAQELRSAGEGEPSPVPWFLASIRTLATRAGFQPLSLRDVRREEKGAFRTHVFWLRARTDLPTITRFLAEVKASEAYLRVSSFTLSPGGRGGRGGGAASGELNADMVLVALAELPESEREAEKSTRRAR